MRACARVRGQSALLGPYLPLVKQLTLLVCMRVQSTRRRNSGRLFLEQRLKVGRSLTKSIKSKEH